MWVQLPHCSTYKLISSPTIFPDGCPHRSNRDRCLHPVVQTRRLYNAPTSVSSSLVGPWATSPVYVCHKQIGLRRKHFHLSRQHRPDSADQSDFRERWLRAFVRASVHIKWWANNGPFHQPSLQTWSKQTVWCCVCVRASMYAHVTNAGCPVSTFTHRRTDKFIDAQAKTASCNGDFIYPTDQWKMRIPLLWSLICDGPKVIRP